MSELDDGKPGIRRRAGHAGGVARGLAVHAGEATSNQPGSQAQSRNGNRILSTEVYKVNRQDKTARKKERKTQTDREASPPDLARRRTQEATHAGSTSEQAGQGRWPDTLLEHAITRGFPARAHLRATPQTGRSGLQAASRDDALPLTRPELVCACLPFSPDHAPLPHEHADGRDSSTMSFWPSYVSIVSKLGLRSPSRPGRV